MTVKEILKLLPDNERVSITYANLAYGLDRKDPLSIDAFGDYVIDGLQAFHDDGRILYELCIALRPIKASEI
jgi:hypothetical protein